MEDTYTIMRIFAGSWGLIFMFTVFAAAVLWTLRPGSRALHEDSAAIPFRHDDKPAPGPMNAGQHANLTEVSQ